MIRRLEHIASLYTFGYSSGVYTILPENKNPILRQKAQELSISEITGKQTQNIIKEMKALLSKEKYGVALAAPQVGEPVRLFIVSGRALARGKRNAPDAEETPPRSGEESPRPLPDQVYINPKLLKMSRGKSPKHEGCLSVRGKWGIVPRAEKATVHAYDENGVKFTRGASGFLAHIFQHELDHLEGVLYTDKAKELYDETPEER
ncbi:MAG: peptide deformylase [bacterium]|nr:peptide deformylase [bacterium]